MKNWCQHIQWGSPQDQPRGGWIIYLDQVHAQVVVIPRTWKVCPICQTPRPGKVEARNESDERVAKMKKMPA